MKSVSCSLVVGERVVARCDDGLLEVEYVLFEPEEVIVAATLGFGVREQGYLTTASFARDRLRAVGITPALAREAFSAIRPGHLRALARTPAILRVIEQLTPLEAFEGGLYSVATGTYAQIRVDELAAARRTGCRRSTCCSRSRRSRRTRRFACSPPTSPPTGPPASARGARSRSTRRSASPPSCKRCASPGARRHRPTAATRS